jgi:hypothetical protein
MIENFSRASPFRRVDYAASRSCISFSPSPLQLDFAAFFQAFFDY